MKGLALTLKSDSNQTKIPHLILKSFVSPERKLYYININNKKNALPFVRRIRDYRKGDPAHKTATSVYSKFRKGTLLFNYRSKDV